MKEKEVRTGGIAKSLAGRDKGRLYMIVGEEGRSLYLADGKYKRAEAPKKKNGRHVRLLPAYFPEIAENLARGKNENSRIRAALLSLSGEEPEQPGET